jgi:hypothetical protein
MSENVMFISLTTIGAADDNLLMRLGEIKAISRSKEHPGTLTIVPHIGEAIEVYGDLGRIRQRLTDAGMVVP